MLGPPEFDGCCGLCSSCRLQPRGMKINFASESSSFGPYAWKATLKGTRKLCVWLRPFPLFFFPGLQISHLTPSRCSGNAAFKYSGMCFTDCFEFQVLRSILFGTWAVAFAPSVGLASGSWEAATAAWGLWADTWISSWTLCGSKKCRTQKTTTGDPCSPRWWPNLCSLNCALPCTSDLQFCFCLASPRCSSFCSLCKVLQKETSSGRR